MSHRRFTDSRYALIHWPMHCIYFICDYYSVACVYGVCACVWDDWHSTRVAAKRTTFESPLLPPRVLGIEPRSSGHGVQGGQKPAKCRKKGELHFLLALFFLTSTEASAVEVRTFGASLGL